MAKLKTEILYRRAKQRGVSRQQRLIAELPRYAPYASRVGGLLALRDRIPGLAGLSEKLFGLSRKRSLPRFSKEPFRDEEAFAEGGSDSRIVLFADTFGRWFEPSTLRASVKVFKAGGYATEAAQPADADKRPLCCGRTYLAAGMIEEARAEARRTLAALLPRIDAGATVVGLEPSCILTLRDEFLTLLPGPDSKRLSEHTMLAEEFLGAEAKTGRLSLPLAAPAKQALLHGHCHQKAFGTMGAVEATLRLIPGMAVDVVESSCCGMAGAFGYDAETIDVSLAMGELSLLPAIRAADKDTIIVADGTSCRHQIADGSGREARHVMEVLAEALRNCEGTAERPALRGHR